MPMKVTFLTTVFAAALPVVSMAQTFFTCGEGLGFAFENSTNYPSYDLADDSIPGGGIALVGYQCIPVACDKIDLLFQDAMGMKSARSLGGEVTLLRSEGEAYLVEVKYQDDNGMTVELYVFDAAASTYVVTTTRIFGQGVIRNKGGARMGFCTEVTD